MTRWIVAVFAVLVLVGAGGLFWWISSSRVHPPAAVAGASAPAPAQVAQTTAPIHASTPPAARSAPPASASAPPAKPSPPASSTIAQKKVAAPASTPPAQTASPAPSAPVATPSAAPAPGAPHSNAAVGAASRAAEASAEPASVGEEPGTQRLLAALDRSVIHFPSGSAGVPASAEDAVKRAADDAKRLPPGDEVEIAGYTDNTGNAALNVALSRRRAEAVREALIADGVNPDLLVAKGYGSADPIASNDTPEGRLRNRRIQFRVVQGSSRTVAGSAR